MKSKDLKILRKKLTKANRDNDPLSNFSKDALTLGVSNSPLSVDFSISSKLPDARLEECLSLFERNMGDMYRNSSWGLNMEEKANELKHANAKILLLTNPNDKLGGFVHFRFEYDDDEQPTRGVLYLYEIQIEECYHRQGLGRKIMTLIEQIASNAELTAVVLTVFKANQSAISFYEKLKYSVDETDPCNYDGPADYKILSRNLK
jgi:ribosomal protein S18 acetylase RimI-like enzyme